MRHRYTDGWYLPGGGVARGESVTDGLRRELREEVGIDLEATSADITFHLGEVIISPTIVRLQVSVDRPSARTDQDWAPIATLRHNGAELNLNGGEPEMFSARGVDDPSGHWELVVTELVGGEIDGEQVRVQGPWTLTFEVP